MRSRGFLALLSPSSRDRDAALGKAVDHFMATIEFDPEGRILAANDRFCSAIGYTREELRGQHHSLFVEPTERDHPDYRTFWDRLRRGESNAGRFRRRAKQGEPVWIEATYSPVTDARGQVKKVVKVAAVITEQIAAEAEANGQIAAIDKVMAVIEFQLDGTIVRANECFLAAMGYQAQDILGKHHSMFTLPGTAATQEYASFWASLRRGEPKAGEFVRRHKAGHEVWLQASYNPILGPDGLPTKVVKLASDITRTKLAAADHAGQLEAIDKVQAVIEFELDGTIRRANANFLGAVGYSVSEVVGKHHRIFVDPAEHHSSGYREFWEELAAGRDKSGQVRRIGKSGQEVWLQANYSPILSPRGVPYKVVKFATDITQQVRLVESLKQMVALMQGFAEKISDASGEIASGNDDLAVRTGSQAASIEQTAAAMEELTSTVRQNADNAHQANDLSSKAAEVARQGGDVVESVVSTMTEISASSTRIGDIIGVIDGIAFQTNILALNAAVEAARAGEQGRGFAVVASEVRSLAQRSAEAAKDIKNLISDSGRTVAAGAARVREAGVTMSSILESVQQVSAIVREIAAASSEQTSGIEQINQTVMQMDQATQQNAAMVEQVSAASHSLDEQASELLKTVSAFIRENQIETR
jgi:methyl-accepting chemotaxis protein